MRNIILTILLLTIPLVCFAKTIILKSGKIVEGKIVEDTESYIRIETTGGDFIYCNKNTIDVIRDNGMKSSSGVGSLQVSFKTGLIDCSDKGYMLFVPKSISSASPAPFLICLPGWGISAKQDINNWAFSAGKKGFIIVDLDVDYNLVRTDYDVDRLHSKISDIIVSLAKQYPVLKDKLSIAGTSAGGMMSLALGLRYPSKFIAVGVVSGGRLNFGAENNLRNARGRWFYMAHGQKDKSVPIGEFNHTKKELEKNGAIVEYRIVPEGEHTLSSAVYKEVVDWLSKVK